MKAYPASELIILGDFNVGTNPFPAFHKITNEGKILLLGGKRGVLLQTGSCPETGLLIIRNIFGIQKLQTTAL